MRYCDLNSKAVLTVARFLAGQRPLIYAIGNVARSVAPGDLTWAVHGSSEEVAMVRVATCTAGAPRPVALLPRSSNKTNVEVCNE